jgi:CHAD domain-containing protein
MAAAAKGVFRREMIAKRKFYRRWKRHFLSNMQRVDKLFAKCRRTGDAEVIHDLRVTLRRARLLALVGTQVLGKAPVRQFRQWALDVATALGRVRDYDVIQEWLRSSVPGEQPDRTLKMTRQRVWRLTRPALKKLPRARRRDLVSWKSSDVKPRKLRDKFLKERERIRAALTHDAARFQELNTDGRHQFRRILRRWRYLCELLLSRGEQKADRNLKGLIEFQEALGEMQNCTVVRESYSSSPHSKSRLKLAGLATLQEQAWLRRSERHLATFLKEDAHFLAPAGRMFIVGTAKAQKLRGNDM